MKSAMACAALIGAILSVTSLEAAAPSISEGEWELSMRMQMDGMPIKMPALTFKTCLSENNPVPRQPERGANACELKEQTFQGNTATWTVVCKDKNTVSETRGRGTYRGTTMEATQTTTITTKGRQQTMTHVMTGRRIGACPLK